MRIRTIISAVLFFCYSFQVSGQFYLRGEVRDEKNTPLTNAKIIQHSTGYIYYSGSSGSFGIVSPSKFDSLTISLDGYHPLTIKADATKYQQFVLGYLHTSIKAQSSKLHSLTRHLPTASQELVPGTGESYTSVVENSFLDARSFPETGFAMRIDKASYSNTRRFLSMGSPVPYDAVRPEEMLNYFNFGYTSPKADSVFGFDSYITDCPWNPLSRLMLVKVSAKKLDPENVPASNLVFLIDVSGSMDMPNRLPLLKSAFKLLVENLREKDTISIVIYGSAVGVWLTPTSGKEKQKIRKAIEDLNPAGATPGQSGILSAYRLAKSQYIPNGNNRVILATDGDFNIGHSSEDELDRLITQHQQHGIYLTCLGVGMGNYKDSKLEILAKKGNGNFAYLDNEKEAEKVLVKELTQTLYTVADDASMNIHFDPSLVKEYRLIGYDNKMKALADSVAELEGGEVGSGHSTMILFEYMPASNDAAMECDNTKTAAVLTVNYCDPNDSLRIRRQTTYPVRCNYIAFEELEPCYRFATSVALFASLLRDSKYTRKAGWTDVIHLASSSYDANDHIQKDFLAMVERARRVYSKIRKRRM
jgi:Ca-activated chloride channel homolog